jgi:hypothetical protein
MTRAQPLPIRCLRSAFSTASICSAAIAGSHLANFDTMRTAIPPAIGGSVKKLSYIHVLAATLAATLLYPSAAAAQQTSNRAAQAQNGVAADQQTNVPPKVQDAQDTVERAVKRFRVGVTGGIGLDPEIIDFGAHATFSPIFHSGVAFRPGLEFGVGELTTMFAINLDFTYTLPGATRQTRWAPYVGAGPTFGLSHRGFESTIDDSGNRFDFGDTDFDGGFNFIVGARSRGGMFMEMKATAYGVSNVKLLAGFTF